MQLRLFITFFLLCFHGFTYGQKTVISNFPLSVNTKAFATLQEKVFASYLLLDSIAVSYTHLDVYKRQV